MIILIIWLTGLPGAGKTTIAYEMKRILESEGKTVNILDGDEVRKKISPDLGFSPEDRILHNKRVIEMAKKLSLEGVVLISLIAPYQKVRDHAREVLSPKFAEVFVKCPLEVCMKRDPKGLYARAVQGEIKNLTGYNDTYEEPANPELVLQTDKESLDESVGKVLSLVRN